MRLIKAVFRAVIWFFKTAFKLIFRVICKAKLWLLIAYLAICGIVQLFTGFFSKTGYNVIFWAGLVIVAVITLFRVLASYGSAVAKKSQDKKAAAKEKKTKEKFPKFYTVSGNPDFFMAEYKDRYELYHVEGDGKLTYIRTDKKESKNG